jgi:hypothetical protein
MKKRRPKGHKKGGQMPKAAMPTTGSMPTAFGPAIGPFQLLKWRAEVEDMRGDLLKSTGMGNVDEGKAADGQGELGIINVN